jgi:hypothetical protein
VARQPSRETARAAELRDLLARLVVETGVRGLKAGSNGVK